MKETNILRMPKTTIEEALENRNFKLVNEFYKSAVYQDYIKKLVTNPKNSEKDIKNESDFYTSLSFVNITYSINHKNVKENYGKLCKSFEKCMKSKISGQDKLLISRSLLHAIKPLGTGSFDFEIGKDTVAKRNDKTVKQDIYAIKKIGNSLRLYSSNILVDLEIRMIFKDAMNSTLEQLSNPSSKISTKAAMNKVKALATTCKKLV